MGGREFMKKVIFAVFFILMLVGCSTQNVQKQPEQTAIVPAQTAEKQEQAVITQEPTIQSPTQTPLSEPKQSNVNKDWFEGAIGDLKIHAKLEFSDNKVYGVYYYDQYKIDIKLEGTINNFTEMKEFKTVSLTEYTDKKGHIAGVFRTDDYFQGFFESGSTVYPMYLIREGSGITPPKQPSSEIKKFAGYWTGKSKNYFAGSHADIKVLFDDLIYYELEAYNGANNGCLDGFGIVNNGVAKTVFKDTIYYDENENVFFEFKIVNDSLNLNSNFYTYMCGMAVGFDSEYVLGDIDVEMPTALQVGIVETEEQEELFKKLVGDKYGEFISYTQAVDYSEVMLDGEKAKVGNSILRGAYGHCKYIISDKYIYAAIDEYDAIYYYTNDKRYANKLPEPMAELVNSGTKIIYNYVE